MNPKASPPGILISLNPLHTGRRWVIQMKYDQVIPDLYTHGICHLNRYADTAKGLISNHGTPSFVIEDYPGLRGVR